MKKDKTYEEKLDEEECQDCPWYGLEGCFKYTEEDLCPKDFMFNHFGVGQCMGVDWREEIEDWDGGDSRELKKTIFANEYSSGVKLEDLDFSRNLKELEEN